MAIKFYNFMYAQDLPKIIEIEQSEIDFITLFQYLEKEYGSVIKTQAVKDGKLAERTRLSLNGNAVYDIHTVIPDGSEVLISHMLPGG
jgi:hypothetical protein